ncbi:CBS domain-containing protein [Kocuria indica]|uniref:CBS domain-containing protein n=1 Tax=Kocuria marina subsp. indica TaxID=1049583 RepID=A0A6N9QVP9_9MICC|nr:CBS domain-containing protein [Kocuria marina]MCT1617389.1 CBS domain-containing protein [Kocuria marina]NDO77209.1 CBS domain-containing protein [Kocuria indica]
MSTNLSKIFVARLIGLDVFDPLGDRLGRLRDVVVLLRSGSKPSVRTRPLIVGLVVEVLGKKRVFVPMTRVTSIDAEQIISTGLVNLRRFEQRGAETLAVGELFDRTVVLLDGSGTATIEDVAMEKSNNRGDWVISQLFVRRSQATGGLIRRRNQTLVVDWEDADDPSNAGPQPATQWIAQHEEDQAADIADELRDMPDKRKLEIAAELQDERLADVLEELPEDDQVFILTHLDNERAVTLLAEMDPDDATDLLNELPEAEAERFITMMEPEDAEDVRRLREYEEGTAGSLMTPVPIVLPPEATVAEALAHIRQEEIIPAAASAVLVCRPPLETPTGKYLGLVHTQRLLRYPPPEAIGNLIDRSIEPVSDQASLADVARELATYDLTILPVVNDQDRLVGAVTIDDVLDALLPEDWRTYDDGTPVRKVGKRYE